MEKELKFEFAADQDAAVRDLATVLHLQDHATSEHALDSEYFDTPEYLLHRCGAALRVRREGGRMVQTLKSAGDRKGAQFEREEYETPLAGDNPDLAALQASVPKSSSLAKLLRTPGLQEQLRPVFRTTVTRKVWSLETGGGETFELALDTGRVIAGEHDRPFSELELELKQGIGTHLPEIGLQLVERLPLRLSMQSKSERGYDLLVTPQRRAVTAGAVTLKKRDTVEAAFCKIVRNCLAQVHANAPLVSAGNSPEGVHQMRVGLRRFRSALDMFADALALPDGLADEVKWMADELGQARDWQVLAHATLPGVDADRDNRDHVSQAEAAAASIAASRHADAARAVQSPRYARLMLALEHWLATAAWRGTADEARKKLLKTRIGAHARHVLRTRHRKLMRRGRGLHKLDTHHRHRARIAAKKLRYAAEFFADLFERKSLKPYRRVLSSLQDDLGWGNDMAVADGLLTELERHHRKVAAGASYARGFLAARLGHDRENQRKLWKRFRSTARPEAI